MTDRLFPSKVLLFGEYTALTGGNALAIPFLKFAGRWKRNVNLPPLQDEFINHLEHINEVVNHAINISKLRTRLLDGWRFDSSIPWGKGLGSSAALSASIYHAFTESEEKKFSSIWHDLSLIEAYFHGKSSGLDAVVSLTSSAVILRNKNELSRTRLPEMIDHMYLLDSQIDRETQPLVAWYRHRTKNQIFMKTMEQLDLWNVEAIESLEKEKSVMQLVNQISELQYEYLSHLIPPHINRLWKKTLDDSETAIKLCGAGGGGYFLVVTSRSPNELVKFYPKFSNVIFPIK